MNSETPEFDAAVVAKKITFSRSSSRKLEKFRHLSLSEKSAVFTLLSPHNRLDILGNLSNKEAAELLDHLDLRRAQHILSILPSHSRRRAIMSRLKNDLYKKLDTFLTFHKDATLSLVHLNYVYLSEDTTVSDTAAIIEDHLENTGKIPVVLVSRNGDLIGEVPLSVLVRERNSAKLKRFVVPIVSINYNIAKDKVVDIFTDNPHKKIAILDNDGSVLGLVYSDDVFELFGGQPASTLYSFVGVSQNEKPFDDTKIKVSRRYKWLVLNLFTAFLAGGVVVLFNDTIDLLPLLAVYMPIVAGMGGNAAAQSAAVTLRGIALGEIELNNCLPALWHEARTGLVTGVIIGSLALVIALMFGHGLWLGILAGLAVTFILVVANVCGMLVPLILKHYGFDPASSSSIFITTGTDVLGFLFLLGMAAWILL